MATERVSIMNTVQDLMIECTEAHAEGDTSREGAARGRLFVAWLAESGISETNATAAVKIYTKIRDLGKRDAVISTLTNVLVKNGKNVNEEAVKALADCMMSRKKWSAKRLRDLFEGKKLYRSLLALRALELGCGDPRDSILAVFKHMAEVGDLRRKDSFVGITGQVQQVHIEWWRAQ